MPAEHKLLTATIDVALELGSYQVGLGTGMTTVEVPSFLAKNFANLSRPRPTFKAY